MHPATKTLLGLSALIACTTTANAAELTPYGFIRVDAIYDTAPMDDAQSPFVVFLVPVGNTAGPEYNLHPRLSRFGLALQGDGGAIAYDGKVEVDFQNGGRESRPLPRMRHAYATIHAGNFSLLTGQTWQTVSRLLPAANGDTLMWGAGNTGDRSPQIRATYRIPIGEGGLDLESAVQAQGTVHNYGQANLNFGPLPAFQERVAFEMPLFEDAEDLHLAVGLHYGQVVLAEKTFGENEFTQFGIFTEARLPITRFGYIDGEYFQGENLADMRGGIGQGINALDDVEIRTQGFWGQGNVRPIDPLKFSVGYGQDTPNPADVADGFPVLNRAIWYVVKVKATDDFTVGVDYIDWNTEYKKLANLTAKRFNLNLTYAL